MNQILVGLNRTGKHVYGGTVSWAEKQKRRARNKVARKQNLLNRRNNV